MIQDFSSLFDGKQTVNVRAVSFREHNVFRKIAGLVLTVALVIGFVSCIIFGLLIKSGLKELEGMEAEKIELIKDQQKLYEQRSVLLNKDKIELAAAGMGLYSPQKKQVRRL